MTKKNYTNTRNISQNRKNKNSARPRIKKNEVKYDYKVLE